MARERIEHDHGTSNPYAAVVVARTSIARPIAHRRARDARSCSAPAIAAIAGA
jgi:hypothetical protein